MNANTEQLRAGVAAVIGREASDEEVEYVRTCMPLVAWLITNQIRGVDAFLRGLPDSLFSLLCYSADEFSTLLDAGNPATWDDEWTCLITKLICDETGTDEVTDEQLSYAAASLVRLTYAEQARRDGCYSWIEPYRLFAGRWPKRIAARLSETGH